MLQQGVFLAIRRKFLPPLFLQGRRDYGIDELANDTHPSVHLILPKLDEWPKRTVVEPPRYGFLSPAERFRE